MLKSTTSNQKIVIQSIQNIMQAQLVRIKTKIEKAQSQILTQRIELIAPSSMTMIFSTRPVTRQNTTKCVREKEMRLRMID